MNQEEKSKIDEMNSSLYSRGEPDIHTKRRLRFSSETTDVKTDWEHPTEAIEDVELNKRYKDTSMSFFTKLFIFSIIIFVAALGIGAYLVFNGSNIVSANNIDIKINGPISVAGGEPISFDIEILNRNNIKLQTVDVAVDFPSGTVDINDTTQELRKLRELIPDIEPGGQGIKTINAVVYGEENSKKEITVTIEYRVSGSNAVFKKIKTFDLLISSSPLTLAISSFKEVNSGQEFEMAIQLTSNSKEIIKNILFTAIYPFGFTYISSDLQPISENNTWKIGDMPPGGKKIIKIKGKLEGQDDEVRVFRFNTGAQSIRNEKTIGTEYVSSVQEVSIKKPFMTVGVSLDGESELQEYVGSFDDPIRIDVSYFNNLPTAIINGEIHVKLSGTAFDKASVSPEQGLYRSAENEIVWNTITNSSLKNIGAGESGQVSFSITPRYLGTQAKPINNPSIQLSINILGKRNSESSVPESITSSARRLIKISSDVSLGEQIVRSVGPFVNTGPIPPKAEMQTSYTVIWTIDNTSNSLSDTVVRSSLPPYVKWLGQTSPSEENISYNPVDGQILWKVGSMGTYTQNNSRRRQVAFQVGMTPNITQVGTTPTLIDAVTLTAQDDFTNQTLNSSLSPLNTRFSTDPTFKDGDERVVQ